MSEGEKRYAKRVATDEGVATVWSDSREVRCLVLNVSTGGMALLTAPGQALARFIRLRANLGAGWPQIDLDAIVLRREQRDGRTLWGIEFYQTPPHILSEIETFVRQHSQSDAEKSPVSSESEPRTEDAAERRKVDVKFTADSHLSRLYKAAERSIGA